MSAKCIDIRTDVLVIGGGTSGCYAAKSIGDQSELKVVVAEKAFIKRSGCLAAGVNALNAYIGQGESAESHTEFISREFGGIVREDLVYGIAKRLNKVTEDLERIGLPILKNSDGSYAMRGKRSVKINGENIKPLLAKSLEGNEQIQVIEQIYIYDLITEDGKVTGALGFHIKESIFYRIKARATVVTAGGAAGIYKPNNPGKASHKMWYSPFNTGTGYAIGIRAGAEMTTFEMRFIALRIKDTIAPTGTIAQSLDTRHINSLGDDYLEGYDRPTTVQRLYQTVTENKEGRGPCYLETKGIDEGVEDDLYKAYLNMAPIQTLKWFESNQIPSKFNVEIEGTEPYSVGGHGASGFWLDTARRTTLPGLYAAGDVAGGSPKKYVTGCLAEAEIAAETIIGDIGTISWDGTGKDDATDTYKAKDSISDAEDCFELPKQYVDTSESSSFEVLEEYENRMQEIMDRHAGGISRHYEYDIESLELARMQLEALHDQVLSVKVNSTEKLKFLFEILDRLTVAKVILSHLEYRKETRWQCYQQNRDYPSLDSKYNYYINSVIKNGSIRMVIRELVAREAIYEHPNR